MSTIEIVYTVFLGCTAIIEFILIKVQGFFIKELKKEISKLHENNDILLDYCLGRILKDAVDSQDYETAKRCKDLLDSMKIIINGLH